MAEGTDNEATKPGPSATVAESSPTIPALSKDAWELIQYRLWDQLRSKMWTTRTVFLMLVTVGGLLGIPAYISSRVDQKIVDERVKFRKLRTEVEGERQRVLALSSATSQMAFLWIQSLAELQRAQLEVLSQLDGPQFQKDEKTKQTWHVFRLLNRTSQDWHTRMVTLNEVKGLALRFFAALRMTTLEGHIVKCTNVLHSGLDGLETATIRNPDETTDLNTVSSHSRSA